MAKKQVAVSLRKPPEADASTSLSRSTQGADLSTRLGERREVTVLLPVEVARRLSVRCLELDRDSSAFVSELLSKALDNEAAPARDVVTITVSGSAWGRVRTRIAELTSWLPWGPLVRAEPV